MGFTNWRDKLKSIDTSIKLSNYSDHSDSELLSNYASKEINPDLYATIYVRPEQSLEYIDVKFTITPSGTTFNEDLEYLQKKTIESLGIPKRYITGIDPANVDKTPIPVKNKELFERKFPKSKYGVINSNVTADYVPHVLTGHKGHTFLESGMVYAPYVPMMETPDPPNIEMELRSVDVAARTRSLRSTWTPEMTSHIEAHHDFDAEAELTALLAQELGNSIDAEIFNSALFPQIQRVEARTLGLDIVSVQPMGAPSGQLFYFDCITHKEIKIEDIQNLRNEIEKGVRLIERWRDSQRGYDFGEYERRDVILYHFKNILYELDGILLKLGRTS